MQQRLFSIYDEKAQAWLPPFAFIHQAQALRAFSDCLNSKDHQFAQHPEDYTLAQIGEWDEQSGVLVSFEKKTILGNGIEVKNTYGRIPDE